MKIKVILAALVVALVSCSAEHGGIEVHVIPEPLQMKVRNSYVDLSKAEMVFEEDDRLGNEAYKISARRNKVTVKASSKNGFLYAQQTLDQMTNEDGMIPSVEIYDEPRFAYRGMHLDPARHFWTVDEVKKYLDIMAIHKMNTFHWHLSDDQGWRIEIKKYPLLTEVGSKRKATALGRGWSNIKYDGIPYEGHYTQEDIREVVAYAASKGIQVIPEIDLPGHMLAAIASYPYLGCTGEQHEVWGRWGISHEVLCAGKEETFTFLENVLLEVIDMFPSKYIHIGGDECPKIRWEECPACQARIAELGLQTDEKSTAVEKLQGYVTNRVEAFLAEHDRCIIGWDEILAGDITQNATIMSWRGTDGGIEASKAGHDVIMTPNTHCYLDYYQTRRIQDEPFSIGGFVNVEKVYSFEPYTPEMTPEQRAHILGVQGNLWTEYIATQDHLEYMLLPRMSALSEVQWCAPEKRNYKRFLDKMTMMVKLYQKLGYNFAKHIFQVQPVIGINVEKACPEVHLSTQGDAPMYYTLDGTVPTQSSTLYTEPVCVKDGEVFKAIVVREDIPTQVYSQSFTRHKAMGKAITMHTEPSVLYSAGLPQSLVNGVLNESEDAAAGEWMAWRGNPMEVVIDMNGETYSRLSVRTFVSKWEEMYPPLGMDAYISEDGKTFELLASEDYPLETLDVPDGIKMYDLEFPETSARYLKIVAETLPSLPAWCERPGKPAYLFLDEIKVE